MLCVETGTYQLTLDVWRLIIERFAHAVFRERRIWEEDPDVDGLTPVWKVWSRCGGTSVVSKLCQSYRRLAIPKSLSIKWTYLDIYTPTA